MNEEVNYNETVVDRLAKVGIKVVEKQVAGWHQEEKLTAIDWANLVLSAEKQKERKLKDGEKKVLVPQKPDFLRKY